MKTLFWNTIIKKKKNEMYVKKKTQKQTIQKNINCTINDLKNEQALL